MKLVYRVICIGGDVAGVDRVLNGVMGEGTSHEGTRTAEISRPRTLVVSFNPPVGMLIQSAQSFRSSRRQGAREVDLHVVVSLEVDGIGFFQCIDRRQFSQHKLLHGGRAREDDLNVA